MKKTTIFFEGMTRKSAENALLDLVNEAITANEGRFTETRVTSDVYSYEPLFNCAVKAFTFCQCSNGIDTVDFAFSNGVNIYAKLERLNNRNYSIKYNALSILEIDMPALF